MFKHISQILQANQLIQSRLREAIASLLPGGKIEGNSYVALNPTRPDKNLGSFRIDLSTGKWKDFASSDHGGDIVSLCAYVKGLSQHQAAQYLLRYFSDYNNDFSRQELYFETVLPPKVPKPPKVVGLSWFLAPKVHLKLSKVLKFDQFDQDDVLNFALKIWKECQSADNSPVDEYLTSRGITGKIPASIRYHPQLYHSPTKSYYPAMVALITKVNGGDDENKSGGEILGIHRTYLSSIEGKVTKAQISPDKMILGRAKGGAVQLASSAKKLVITEGIETALSIMQATSLPVWAALSASNMQNIILPPLDSTQEIIIAADHDEAGLTAANKLARRLQRDGYIVCIAIPPELGVDFNDLLLDGERSNDQ